MDGHDLWAGVQRGGRRACVPLTPSSANPRAPPRAPHAGGSLLLLSYSLGAGPEHSARPVDKAW